MTKGARYRFQLWHLHLLVFSVATAFAVLNAGFLTCFILPLVVALYYLGIGLLARGQAAGDRNERLFVIVYAVALLTFAILLIVGVQFLQYR